MLKFENSTTEQNIIWPPVLIITYAKDIFVGLDFTSTALQTCKNNVQHGMGLDLIPNIGIHPLMN